MKKLKKLAKKKNVEIEFLNTYLLSEGKLRIALRVNKDRIIHIRNKATLSLIDDHFFIVSTGSINDLEHLIENL